MSDNERCWRCGRATPDWSGTGYVFGVVCDRAECHRVKQAFSKRFVTFWFRFQLPGPDSRGRMASFTLDGDLNNPRGMGEPDLQTKIESDRKVKP